MRPSPGSLRPLGRPTAGRPGGGREGAGTEQSLLRPARPLWLGVPLPHPPECGRARPPGGLSRLGPERALRPLPFARPSRGGLSGGSACPSYPLPPSLLPSLPGGPAPPPAYCGDSPRAAATGAGAAAAGPAKRTAGARGVLGRGSASRSALAGAFRVPRSPSPTRGRGARPCPRVHGRRAGGRPALGRVRSVRWRWGRREPELSQAPGPPDRAKWGVMAAGGSGCTSSAGGGGGSGRGVNPRRSGRCVCVFLFGVCAAGGRGMEPGATGKPEQWSCPLLGDFPQPPLGRAPCPPPASRTSGRLGWLFPRGQRERGRGRPGRGRAAEQRLSHCVFCLFFSPKVPFPSVRRPAGP